MCRHKSQPASAAPLRAGAAHSGQPEAWSTAQAEGTGEMDWRAVFRLAKARGARSVLVLTWSATPASEMLMSVIELFDGK